MSARDISVGTLCVDLAMGKSITLGNLRTTCRLWLGACGDGFLLLEVWLLSRLMSV